MSFKLPSIPLAIVILSITGVYMWDSHLHVVFQEAEDDLRPHTSCTLYPHNVIFTRDDCNHTVSLMSCSGRCVSETTPYFFSSRKDLPSINNKRYSTNCMCCGITHTRVAKKKLDFSCENGSTIYSDQILSTAIDCACADCET